MNNLLAAALGLLLLGNILAWFQGNLQFVSDWWYSRPFFTIIIFAIPTATCFFFGWRFLVEYLDESLWSARLFSFGLGTIIFALFSFYIKGEGLNKKTIICLLLSVSIILIQTLWPNKPSAAQKERSERGIDYFEKS